MTTDAWLAIVHHLAVFGLVAVLAAEWGLVRPGVSLEGARRVARIDALYGVSAGAVLLAGLARLEWGAQPWGYYADQPAFWVKMAAFAAVGLLSIAPTRRYLRWRSLEAPPADDDVRAARRSLRLQLAVLPVIPIAAALMARSIGG